MFDFLKKKITGFIDTLTSKGAEKEKPKEEKLAEEKRTDENLPAAKPLAPEVVPVVPAIGTTGGTKKELPKQEKAAVGHVAQVPKPKQKPESKPESKPELKAQPKSEQKQEPKKQAAEKPTEKPEAKAKAGAGQNAEQQPKTQQPKTEQTSKPKQEPPDQRQKPELKPEQKPEPKKEQRLEPTQEPEQGQTQAPEPPLPKPKEPEKEKPEKARIKLSAISAVKSLLSREVEITENDVGTMLETLELELLEADVDMDVAAAIREDLRKRLVGTKAPKSELHQFISSAIKDSLVDVISNECVFDLVERIKASEKPVKIIFFGINGAGKTTTLAKVARLLMDDGNKVVFAAADTFRAAAIEQLETHANRLGVKVVKRDYGSDPTSVAYDAVNYAKAHSIDAVLIDTAGRQDTNLSLINEMKKMVRVIQPDLKIYLGESIAGNAIVEQISSFNREVGVDAVILTKLDCDAKGGTMLSINKATGVPIIYVGTGQGYGDLEKFDARKIVDRIVA